MKTTNKNIPYSNTQDEPLPLDSLLSTLIYKLENNPACIESIQTECSQIKLYLESFTKSIEYKKILPFLSWFEKSSEETRTVLYSLLQGMIPKLDEQLKPLDYLLSSSDEKFITTVLDFIKNLIKQNYIKTDQGLIELFAAKTESSQVLSGQNTFQQIACIIKEADHLAAQIYLQSKESYLRNFAAKFLDLKETLVSEEMMEKFLGKKASGILAHYLAYTRAAYQDLLYLIPSENQPPPILDSLIQCETVCKQNVIREVIAKLGWKSVNYGLSIKHLIGVNFNGSLPFFLTESEAKLFEKAVNGHRTSEFYLFTAHGGPLLEASGPGADTKPVALFRSYNLAHANLLGVILDIGPLTPGKVRTIIEQLDQIVADFITLFSRYSEECKILPDVYGKLKDWIRKELDRNTGQSYLSAEATRLVQMFEDPNSLAEVHTLHGLKRYLHQRGLQLGFKLVDQTHATNESISLVLASPKKVLTVLRKINFANFEPDTGERSSVDKVPYPIKVVIDAFERQLLYGQESFPSVNIFCYGNEVHYFVWFRNHPVFIRIDYSPPLQGGMIDLQYFGVSNYEIADHPNINLDAIRYFFQFLEFDVKVEGTHIHARYDKERALDLSQLCERVEYLFGLAVYLMDLDWVIGSFNLTDEARMKVIKAWAAFFSRWGVLLLSRILSKDRLGIIQSVFITPEGEYESVWNGDDEYRDRFSIEIPGGFFNNLFKYVDSLCHGIQKFTAENFSQFGQVYLEKKLLFPLREALAEGEIRTSKSGFEKTSNELFRKIHEAFIFKDIIRANDDGFKSFAILAKTIAPLEQTLKFQTTGTLESFTVQSAILPLHGHNLKLFGLRDYKGIFRLAFFIYGNSLYQKRKSKDDEWQTNVRFSPVELMSLFRYFNYTVAGSEASYELTDEEIQRVRYELQLRQRPIVAVHIPGEKIITGLGASPGRTTGRVLLGAKGRLPEDFNNRIFVAPSVSPDDNTTLFHSDGVVATGGSILSHAGLIATQFNKPALIIEGEWKKKTDGTYVLIYRISEYMIDHKVEDGFNISIYHDLLEHENQLQDGDLVVLDANEGKLQVLGQERDAVNLYENLRSLGKTNEAISRVNDVREIMILRGKKLQIKHQIEKLLQRINEPVLLRYAVQEILLGKFLEGNKSSPDERAHFLSIILSNDTSGRHAEKYLLNAIVEIENKFLRTYEEAERDIPLGKYPFEIVMERLKVIQIYEIIRGITPLIGKMYSEKIRLRAKDISVINKISIKKLEELRGRQAGKIFQLSGQAERREFLRHFFRQLERIDMLLNTPAEELVKIKELRIKFEIDDEAVFNKLGEKFILRRSDGALELAPMIGWKAANLAELGQLGWENLIPSWFAVTDRAFQRTLDNGIPESYSFRDELILKGTPLREVIDKIVSAVNVTNNEKSLHIRKLWNLVSLDEDIKKEIFDAYNEIEAEYLEDVKNKKTNTGLFLAVRSSSCEEDAEIAARAGEFETYLFIQGKYSLIEFLKRTWSGLWTERAIHNRAAFGYQRVQTRGGVIVQRIVHSRVSGVLQTINAAKGDLKEIVINAGSGLGEGVVSGLVAADQIIVSREGDLQNDPLHFNYITADKKQQVLFNQKAGFGTVLMPTLYHQRFRPALEYVELCELVAIASQLEDAYGYPIDIEFGIEGTRLWILQVRPVPTFLPALKETIEHYPLRTKNKIKAKEKSQ